MHLRVGLLAFSQLITLCTAIFSSVSRVDILYDVNERYMYHQQKRWNFANGDRDRCCLYVGGIVGALGPSPVVLHMLQFMNLRYIFQFWPFEFYLSDKILINIGEVFWCCIILVYLAVCHNLQYQRLLEGPGICSLFFMNFNGFNYIQMKI